MFILDLNFIYILYTCEEYIHIYLCVCACTCVRCTCNFRIIPSPIFFIHMFRLPMSKNLIKINNQINWIDSYLRIRQYFYSLPTQINHFDIIFSLVILWSLDMCTLKTKWNKTQLHRWLWYTTTSRKILESNCEL